MRWKPISDDTARRMYRNGRGDATARRLARMWGWIFARGLVPRRWVRVEVAGWRSGEPRSFPLGMADHDGQWYLVSMLGECSWVRNVRAADGHVVVRRRRGVPATLHEIPAEQRGPILRRYLQKVPGARPHLPVDQHASSTAFESIAADHAVFRVDPASGHRLG